MKFYSNKFFISFLILTVLFYGFSAKMAEAKGVASIITQVIIIAVVIVAIAGTGGFGAAIASVINPLVSAGLATAMGIVGGTLMGAVVVGQAACLMGANNPMFTGCGGENNSSWQGAAGSPTLQNQTATPIKSNESCTTGFTLSYSVTDAYQYGIYRDNNLINQGILNTVVQPSPYNTSFSYADNNLAPNVNYKYSLILTDKNGKQYSYPEMTAYTECSPHIVFNGPDIVEVPNSITLSWIAENVTSLIASGDWSGSKEMGIYPYKSESLSKPRGTYTFILSGTGPGGSDSKQVVVQVIKVPRCTFAADPTSIILPQTSTLSWSCSYADVCSIDQGVGSVNNISGSQEVRPSATTTYTLSCDGLDGERTWQATVNVGFTPRLREIAP
jgi:hypothetical protein